MKLAAAAAFLLLSVPALAASRPAVASVGRDLVLSRSVPGRVIAVAADVRVESAVAGDVIVWGGDVSFGPLGSVAGNLVVFGGTIRGVPGRPLPVAGTVSTPGSLLPLYLAEMRRAPWDTNALSPLVWGLRLLALAAWLLIAALLLYLRDRTGRRPHAYFNWTEGNPVLYLIRYVLSGEGEIAPVTREILRRQESDPARRPAIHAAM